jgi:hypothetical protein
MELLWIAGLGVSFDSRYRSRARTKNGRIRILNQKSSATRSCDMATSVGKNGRDFVGVLY